MNSGIPGSGRPGESLEQLFGSVFDLAGRFAARIGQDQVEARLRLTLEGANRREEWDQIVDRYAPLVYTICRRHQLADHDAQDVAQQVWRLLAERIATLREPAALPRWLATTTTRECLRVLRTAQQAGRPDLPVDEATIAAEIRIAEQDAAIMAAFAELPTRCQQLLSMLVSDPPHSYQEISDKLGIPFGSIGPSRARCLSRLRHAITHSASQDSPADEGV